MLPAFHAITGCDTTSGLSRVGKPRAWKVLCKDIEKFDKLADLGTAIKPSPDIIASTGNSDVDFIRYQLFCRKQAVN